jgi:hypothetical protein
VTSIMANSAPSVMASIMATSAPSEMASIKFVVLSSIVVVK